MPGWREGNVVADPDGQLWDVLTFEARPLRQDVAAMVKIEDQGRLLSFEPSSDAEVPGGFIPFPGAKAKFTLRRDPGIRRLPHPVQRGAGPGLAARPMGRLPDGGDCASICGSAMCWRCGASADLCRWRVVKTLLQDDSGLAPEDSVRLTGYQYVDWQFDGDDLIYVVRTAARGARNFHDSNRILFGRERGFRSLL